MKWLMLYNPNLFGPRFHGREGPSPKGREGEGFRLGVRERLRHRTLHATTLAALLISHIATAAEAPSLKLGGNVEHPQIFTLADLKAMPPTQVDASFGTMHGQEHHVWTGVKLLALIEKAGMKTEKAKFAVLRHSVLISGNDGYAVALSMGEMEPMAENKPVILAYRSDAAPTDLPGLRLVVPNDQHGARQVHDVTEIDVQ